jgi:hypothetical protein
VTRFSRSKSTGNCRRRGLWYEASLLLVDEKWSALVYTAIGTNVETWNLGIINPASDNSRNLTEKEDACQDACRVVSLVGSFSGFYMGRLAVAVYKPWRMAWSEIAATWDQPRHRPVKTYKSWI